MMTIKKEVFKLSEEKVENEEVKETNEVSNKEFEELNDRYKRLFAEFENYKKRTQKESLSKYAEITGDVVSSILPVMDNLEKAALVKTEDTNYQEGVKMVVKQFSDVLSKFGIVEIETIGKRFDPELHEAVSHIEDSEKQEQEIVEEYRKGSSCSYRRYKLSRWCKNGS